jgi:hypothetical protein
MKTHIKKLRNPNYIGSWDLLDENGTCKNRILTIESVKNDTVFDGKGGSEECTVLTFTGAKPMILNSTNIKTICKVLDTPFIEDWAGKNIEITVKKIRAFGEMHDALRVVSTDLTLTPKHPKWAGAKKALVEGNVTIEAIKKTYSISEENQKLLSDAN